MKKMIFAALALMAVTRIAHADVLCTITDDNRIPVLASFDESTGAYMLDPNGERVTYERTGNTKLFCAKTDDELKKNKAMHSFVIRNNFNSSRPSTLKVAAVAKKITTKADELGARAAKTASSKLESASQQVGAKLQPAASQIDARLQKGVERIKQTEAYKKLEEGTTQADVLGKKAVKKLETCVLADKNRMALVREDGSHFEFDKKSTTCKLADAPQELQDEAQGKAVHAINKNLIKVHESVHVVKESAKEKFAQAKTAISEKAAQAKKAVTEKVAQMRGN